MKLFSYYFRSFEVDVYRNFGLRSIKWYKYFFSKKIRFFLLFRINQYLLQYRCNNIYKFPSKILQIMYNKSQRDFGIDFPASCKVGEGLFLPHPNGIVINGNTIIGKNCTVLQQVTIGNNIFKDINGVAKLGDNVQIGAGAKIIGPCVIGNNVTIGANSVVLKDIKSGCVVAGIPARVIGNKIAPIFNEIGR